MNSTSAQTNSDSILVLKTNFFNDEAIVNSSLQIELADNTIILDISDKSNAEFTDADWDRILNSILSSTKVITA